MKENYNFLTIKTTNKLCANSGEVSYTFINKLIKTDSVKNFTFVLWNIAIYTWLRVVIYTFVKTFR